MFSASLCLVDLHLNQTKPQLLIQDHIKHIFKNTPEPLVLLSWILWLGDSNTTYCANVMFWCFLYKSSIFHDMAVLPMQPKFSSIWSLEMLKVSFCSEWFTVQSQWNRTMNMLSGSLQTLWAKWTETHHWQDNQLECLLRVQLLFVSNRSSACTVDQTSAG